ncbi:MAG: branched-chain amino acid ABC transporter permease [Deltaproteobacteria bacterium]|nr:branched-chain amino acid ABC transporter permease [Deltaproteobacteria bacterium]
MNGGELQIFFQLILSGLIVGSIYGLVALGFVLIYKATNVVNFAQGELMMLGAYFCYYLVSSYQIPFVPAFLITLVFSSLLGILIEVAILRPLVGETVFSVIMVTVGLSTLLRSVVGLIWGHDQYVFPSPFSQQTFRFFELVILPVELTTIVTVMGLFAMCYLFFKYSKIGVAMRATAFNQKYAFLMGISVRKVFSLSWVMASVVASIGGILFASMSNLDTNMSLIGLKVFPAVVLGGIDSIGGAILGGLIVGLTENLAGGYLSQIFGSGVKELSAFFVLLMTLMIRPYGLFGKKEIIRV